MPVRKKKQVKKKASALAIRSGSAVANVSSEKQSKYAQYTDAQKDVAPKIQSSDWISTSATGFVFGENELGLELDVVIVDFAYFNSFFGFGNVYDPDNITPPECMALSETSEDMLPHELIKQPQADACADCELNKFGSAEKGKGKACKNYIRIAVVHVDDLQGGSMPKLHYIKLPPTAITPFAELLGEINSIFKLPTFAVGVKLSIVGLPMGFSVGCEIIGDITDESIIDDKIFPLRDIAKTTLLTAPDFDSAGDKPVEKSGKKKATAKKSVVKKKAAKRKAKY